MVEDNIDENSGAVMSIQQCISAFPHSGRDELKHLLLSATEENPPIVFVWNEMANFLNSAQNFIDAPAPNGAICPLLPYLVGIARPISIIDFKNAILRFVLNPILPVPPPPTFCGVLKLSLPQATQAVGELTSLCYDPWFIAIQQFSPQLMPLAQVVMPIPPDKGMSLVLTPGKAAPCNLWS